MPDSPCTRGNDSVDWPPAEYFHSEFQSEITKWVNMRFNRRYSIQIKTNWVSQRALAGHGKPCSTIDLSIKYSHIIHQSSTLIELITINSSRSSPIFCSMANNCKIQMKLTCSWSQHKLTLLLLSLGNKCEHHLARAPRPIGLIGCGGPSYLQYCLSLSVEWLHTPYQMHCPLFADSSVCAEAWKTKEAKY